MNETVRAKRDEQVETLERAGGNTVVNCHDTGITLADSSTIAIQLPRRGRALDRPMSRNPERKSDEVFSRHGKPE